MALRAKHLQSHTVWLLVMDCVCLLAGGALGLLLRIGREELGEYVYLHVDGWLVLFGSVILANYLAGGYGLQHTFSRFNLVVTWLFSLIFALAVVSLTSYAWVGRLLGRGVLVLTLAWYSGLSLVLKLLVYGRLFRSGLFLCRVVVIGTGRRARRMRAMLENEWVLPAHKVISFARVLGTESPAPDPGAGGSQRVIDGVAVAECTRDSVEVCARSLDANLVVLGLDDPDEGSALFPQLRRLRFEGIEVLTPLAVSEAYAGRTPLDLLDEDVLMRATLESGMPLVRRVKRVTDILVSALALVLLAPAALAIALLLKLSAPRSPVFYSQQRVGLFGKPYRMYKFRTMRENAEEESGAVWASEKDPRITRIGRVLRRFRLDEIAQFVNVLNGDMSIVGPRPERPELVAELEKKIRYYSERSNVMPGLTGWAQIRFPYGDSVADAERKFEYDLYYIKYLSFSLDLQIVLRTLRIVLFGLERAEQS